MRVAFRTGGVVGMATVGLGLLGAATVVRSTGATHPAVLEGFGFGAALLAMFMRVGGGIFTKAADVGADLVGKVEAGIPEDDPRNAATIADNVGDNVGDCAAGGADLFESYAVMLVAALILGRAAFGAEGLVFPLVVPAIGALTAVLGIYLTRPRPGRTACARSTAASTCPHSSRRSSARWPPMPTCQPVPRARRRHRTRWRPAALAALAVIVGIVLAGIILWLTGYFTGTNRRPVRRSAATPPAPRRSSCPASRSGWSPRSAPRRYRGCGLRGVPPRRRLDRPLAVPHRAGLHGPVHDRGRHRRHGHVRPHRATTPRASPRCLATWATRCADPHRARCRRQHHQGDHQGHRDRQRRCWHRAVRVSATMPSTPLPTGPPSPTPAPVPAQVDAPTFWSA